MLSSDCLLTAIKSMTVDTHNKLYQHYIESVPVKIVFFEDIKNDLQSALTPVCHFINRINQTSRNHTRKEVYFCLG